MKYKGTLIVVKDCNRALKFYSEIIEPQIVAICCGNQDYAKDLKEEINKTDWGKNVKVEMYYHPAMRWIKDEEYVKPIG